MSEKKKKNSSTKLKYTCGDITEPLERFNHQVNDVGEVSTVMSGMSESLVSTENNGYIVLGKFNIETPEDYYEYEDEIVRELEKNALEKYSDYELQEVFRRSFADNPDYTDFDSYSREEIIADFLDNSEFYDDFAEEVNCEVQENLKQIMYDLGVK